QFRVQVRTPTPSNCLLFEEIHTRDLSKSSGIFSITLNDGTASSLNTEPFTLDRVFQNRGTFQFAPGKCAGSETSFTPSASTGRMLDVWFNDGCFSHWEPLPAQSVNFVPAAFESVTVGGHRPNHFFRVHDDNGEVQNLDPWTMEDYSKLKSLIENTLF